MLYDDGNLKTICNTEVSNMKSLILYYSYRGNTQRIAERIHSAIGGDIARIDTVVPYTGSYDDVVAQGEREVKQGFLPELKAMDIDLDRYDTIVLGTPVWWYTCAPATRAFLTAHEDRGRGHRRRDGRRSAGARTGRPVHERRPGLQQRRQPRLARA